MAKPKKPAGAKPIVDVAQPGKSAPATNSKSVIMSNRPLLKDPMMVANQPKPGTLQLTAPLLETEPPDELAGTIEPSKTTKATKTVEPSEPAEPAAADDAPAAQVDDTKPDKPEKPEADAAEADKPKPDETEAQTEKSETTDEEAVPSKEDDIKQAEAEATEQAKHQAAIDKLADSKQYYLSINTVEKRRSKRFVVLGVVVSLLLVLAWLDIALDAGLIKLGGIKSLTHFFSN